MPVWAGRDDDAVWLKTPWHLAGPPWTARVGIFDYFDAAPSRLPAVRSTGVIDKCS
jgi:hypothetical protein